MDFCFSNYEIVNFSLEKRESISISDKAPQQDYWSGGANNVLDASENDTKAKFPGKPRLPKVQSQNIGGTIA